MKVLIHIFLILIITVSCLPEPNSDGNANVEANRNPLDSILGEKIINEKTKAIRKDNFSNLDRISRTDLEAQSSLYDVESVDETFYTINQERHYSKARLFSIILKVDDTLVQKYEVKKDFKIIDQIKDKNGITVLFGNFGNFSKHWETNNEVQLIKFDNQLNQLWTYSPNSNEYVLEPLKIEKDGAFTKLRINIVTGCDICTNMYELKIDNKGNCFSARGVERQNSTVSIERQKIKEIFNIP